MTICRAVPSTNDATCSGSRTAPARSFCEHHHEHVLHEIGGRGLVAQVLEAVEPYPRPQAPADLGLRGRVALGRAADDPPRERGVVVRVRAVEAHGRSIRIGASRAKTCREV